MRSVENFRDFFFVLLEFRRRRCSLDSGQFTLNSLKSLAIFEPEENFKPLFDGIWKLSDPKRRFSVVLSICFDF